MEVLASDTALIDRDYEFLDNPELLVETLEPPNVDINQADTAGLSLLSKICISAYLHPTRNVARIFQLMLDAGADVNARCADGYSPLRYLAISFTYEPTEDMPDQPELEDAVWDLFDMLIKAGANPVAAEIADNPDIAPAIRAYIEAWIIGGKPPRERTKSRGIRDV